jgi:hypothetical protein
MAYLRRNSACLRQLLSRSKPGLQCCPLKLGHLPLSNGQTVPIICEDGYMVPNISSGMLDMFTGAYIQARVPLRNSNVPVARAYTCDGLCVLILRLRVVVCILLYHDTIYDNALATCMATSPPYALLMIIQTSYTCVD